MQKMKVLAQFYDPLTPLPVFLRSSRNEKFATPPLEIDDDDDLTSITPGNQEIDW